MPGKHGREHDFEEGAERASQGGARLRPPARLSTDDEERLSAYLDDALSATERASLERRLRADPSLAQALSELRAMRGLLRALPQPTPPRSFLLPEDENDKSAEIAQLPAHSRRAASGRGARQAAPLWARVVMWSGELAAIVGIALFLGLLMTNGATLTSSEGSATNAPQTYHATTAGSSTTQARTVGTPQYGQVTPNLTNHTPTTSSDKASTPTAPVATTPSNGSNGSPSHSMSRSFPFTLLPTLAILLVIVGLLLVVFGWIGGRARG